MSKFLADTTTIKFLGIFKFRGPKKDIPPWREVLFDWIYPAAVCKGLKG
jgi:hypothetical protein